MLKMSVKSVDILQHSLLAVYICLLGMACALQSPDCVSSPDNLIILDDLAQMSISNLKVGQDVIIEGVVHSALSPQNLIIQVRRSPHFNHL